MKKYPANAIMITVNVIIVIVIVLQFISLQKDYSH